MSELLNSQSTELLLNELSLDLMKDNIIDQIRSNDFDTPQTDFCSILINKYYTIIRNPDNVEFIQEINFEMIDFCTDIINELNDKMDLMINHPLDSLTVIQLMKTLYDFFIIRRKEYVFEFFKNYITYNRDSLITALDLSEKSKDVTTMANRKRNINKAMIPIISNIQEVMDYIITSTISVDELFNIINDGDVIILNMMNYISEFVIVGNFANDFISDLIGDYSDDLTSSIRNNLRYAFYNN